MNAGEHGGSTRLVDLIFRRHREPWPNDLRRAFKLFVGVFVLWMLGVIVTSIVYANGKAESIAGTLAQAGACSAAAFAIGAAFGLVFGIPKSVGIVSDPDIPNSRYAANTALEQISDWFTKIVVGLGLTQFSSALQYGERIVRAVAAGIGGNQAAAIPFAAALLIISSVIGFLLHYLLNRTILPYWYESADLLRFQRKQVHRSDSPPAE